MKKNIVVFSDGTGQEGGKGTNSNVYKLFNMVLDRSAEQVAFYDRGLGTGWRKVLGNVAGAGISKNIKECYRFIFEEYCAGDEIFLFGFSRGAATVRSLSGFINLFGLLPKSRPELIDKAYKIYKIKNETKRLRRVSEFRGQHNSMGAQIQFLGVWETVAALGLPLRSLDVIVDRLPFCEHHFHDFKLAQCVSHAYQALAIDDERKTFHPILWDLEKQDDQILEQVWFCGMHTDVGGGYPASGLSDIALEWMVQKAVDSGLRIYDKQALECHPDAAGWMHDSRQGVKRLYRRETRSWPSDRTDRPVVHESALGRYKRNQVGSEPADYKPWILGRAGGYDIEPWLHPKSWPSCPKGLENWCYPLSVSTLPAQPPASQTPTSPQRHKPVIQAGTQGKPQ